MADVASPAVAPVAGGQGQGQYFRTASLYVGDLAPTTTETILYEVFSQVGRVASVRIPTHAVTRQSLGYGFVNFYDPGDAERALEHMNHQVINGRPCRVMWIERDPSRRKTGKGNVVVKSLHESVDNRTLQDFFSQFGNILSCKVSQDPETGASRGYGFVHFDNEAAATEALTRANGAALNGQEIIVEAYKSNYRNAQAQWTNLYVKNVPLSWDDDKLMEIFSPYGEIKSAKIMRWEGERARDQGNEGKSKGFGFVDFAQHEQALQALEELNGKNFPDGEGEDAETKALFVGRLQKKDERRRELTMLFADVRSERAKRFQGCNVFCKNLDEGLEEEWLLENFGQFGTITSARVMKDQTSGQSRGFGFVCFSSPEEATQAIQRMNNRMVNGRPIYVALAQPAAQRREMQAQFHQQRLMGPPAPQATALYGTPALLPQQQFGMLGAPYGAMAAAPMAGYRPQPMQMGPGGYMRAAQQPYGDYGQRPSRQRGGGGGGVVGANVGGAYGGGGGGGGGGGSVGGAYSGGGGVGGAEEDDVVQQQQQQQQQPPVRGGFAAADDTPPPPPQQQAPVRGGFATAAKMSSRGRSDRAPPAAVVPAPPPPLSPSDVATRGGPTPTRDEQQRQMMIQQQAAMAAMAVQQSVAQRQQQKQQRREEMARREQQEQQEQQQQLMQQQQQQQQGQYPGESGGRIDTSLLASAPESERKNILGEWLYPRVHSLEPDLAGKITGMILELDNTEILHLLEAEDGLHEKIREAVSVLTEYQAETG